MPNPKTLSTSWSLAVSINIGIFVLFLSLLHTSIPSTFGIIRSKMRRLYWFLSNKRRASSTFTATSTIYNSLSRYFFSKFLISLSSSAISIRISSIFSPSFFPMFAFLALVMVEPLHFLLLPLLFDLSFVDLRQSPAESHLIYVDYIQYQLNFLQLFFLLVFFYLIKFSI